MGSIADSHAEPSRPVVWPRLGGTALGLGLVTAYLSLIVLIPLAAVVARSTQDGFSSFWDAVTNPEAMAALKLTLVASLIVVLLELDRDMEEAAASLGAGPLTVFRRVIFPNLTPAILAGVALAFARSIGEFGSVILISGSQPFKTEVSSVFIFGQIESGNTT